MSAGPVCRTHAGVGLVLLAPRPIIEGLVRIAHLHVWGTWEASRVQDKMCHNMMPHTAQSHTCMVEPEHAQRSHGTHIELERRGDLAGAAHHLDRRLGLVLPGIGDVYEAGAHDSEGLLRACAVDRSGAVDVGGPDAGCVRVAELHLEGPLPLGPGLRDLGEGCRKSTKWMVR